MVPDEISASLFERAYRVRTSLMHAVLDVLGDPWNLSIIREIFSGVQHFDALIARLGISRPALSKRLDKLVNARCLVKTLYCPHPPRYDYSLAPKGQSLRPVLLLLAQWNEDWIPHTEPSTLRCKQCGQRLRVLARCAGCHDALNPQHLKTLMFVGLPSKLPPMPEYRRTRHHVASKESAISPSDIRAEQWLQDRWSALILGGLMLGLQRYADFLAVLGIAPNILAGRLDALQRAGLVMRTEEGRYALADRGVGLYPAIMAMRDWGMSPLEPAAASEPGWNILHVPCGEWLKLEYVCAHCHQACF